jgi:carbon monoxide dehydrogenase subunit G
MNLVIASISGVFDGKVRIANESPPDSFRLLVDGTGRAGFLKGDGLLTLVPTVVGSTEVRYDGEVQTGGLIASVGQRLLDATAKMLIKRFFEKFTAAAETPGRSNLVLGI